MKYLVIISSLFILVAKAACQTPDFIKLIFSDRENLHLATSFEHSIPQTIFLLSQTTVYPAQRFILDARPGKYSEGGNPYLFTDSLLAGIFSSEERGWLFKQSKKMIAGRLLNDIPGIHVISSFRSIKQGFFFSVTKPVFSKDKEYAFIDLGFFYKEEGETEFRDTYFGETSFIFKYSKQAGWTLLKKREHLYL